MSFEPKKFNAVFEDMRQRSAVITDFETGSVARTLYESFAYEIALLYEKMRLVYLSAYVDTAEGQQLDMVVAILGVKRGLPDFAEGVVSFSRDPGNQDIGIPFGTLVATTDTPDAPKIVYQTIEAKNFPKGQTALDINVQAVERGEENVTAADTLVVLPRPIPGVKATTNAAATRFTGKRRETDEALRERAKNTLISSGKATILSIENALLSLPGVKEAKVKENFHFAEGEITLSRGGAGEAITVPKGTRLTVTGTGQQVATTAQVALAPADTSTHVNVQSVLEGSAGEVAAAVVWQLEDPSLAALTANNPEPLKLGDFGVIEVFVDGVDFGDPAAVREVQDEIDRVRAAGIFVLLKPVTTVDVDAIFKVDLRPDLKITPEERAKLEGTVRDAIIRYIEQRQIGQPLLFSQIVKDILSLNGVENLEDFAIRTSRSGDPHTFSFSPADKRIEIAAFEKLAPRHLCVASEVKPLVVDVQFKAPGLDAAKRDQVQSAISDYFGGLKIGQAVVKSDILKRITDLGIVPEAGTLQLAPHPWCQQAPSQNGDPETISASFVERASPGQLFAYSRSLKISGAIRLTLPTVLTDQAKDAVRTQIRSGITGYLDNLQPESDLVFADLVKIAAAVSPVVAVNLEPTDFRVLLDADPTVGRVSEKSIDVRAFEKAQLDHFCITSEVIAVRVQITAVAVELVGITALNQDSLIALLKQGIKNTIGNFFAKQKAGENLVFGNLRSAIESLVPDLNYTVLQLDLNAAAACDNRVQTRSLALAQEVHIRSVEIATLVPFSNDLSEISITDSTTPAPAPPGGGG